ncbi:MAG: twin-arginine translocase subunit TatC [Acidobacteria bacterium]|nr:twin-arginine translocase subunit TatC [Acidobacteriota bacterium]
MALITSTRPGWIADGFGDWVGHPFSGRDTRPDRELSRDRRAEQKRWLVWGLAVTSVISEGTMSFLDHLDELRKRLIVSVAALSAGVLIAYAFVSRIHDFMMKPLAATLPPGSTFVFTEPMEQFVVRLKMAALAGVFLAAPVILWQVWLFVAPGLYAREKKFAIPFVLFSSLFFAAGGLFSHFVAFRWAFAFFGSYATETVEFMPRIAPTFSMYMRMLLAFGAIFQMPTLAFFLTRVGLITARLLIRNVKYAVLVVFIVAAVLTPSPDFVNQLIMAGPMLVLYGLSILIAWVFAKRPGDSDPE